MHCGSCKHFDESDTWGSKCYCEELKIYVYADDDGCGKYEARGSSGGGCYLTTACCAYRNLPDDCHELTVMRRMRDSYLRKTDEGRRLITEYYQTAPAIVERIDASDERDELYGYIYRMVTTCVGLAEAGDCEGAKQRYLEMVQRLKRCLLDES